MSYKHRNGGTPDGAGYDSDDQSDDHISKVGGQKGTSNSHVPSVQTDNTKVAMSDPDKPKYTAKQDSLAKAHSDAVTNVNNAYAGVGMKASPIGFLGAAMEGNQDAKTVFRTEKEMRKNQPNIDNADKKQSKFSK